MTKRLTNEEIDADAVRALREFLVPYTTFTQELATTMVKRLRQARLLRSEKK